jgi:hypothetical protein
VACVANCFWSCVPGPYLLHHFDSLSAGRLVAAGGLTGDSHGWDRGAGYVVCTGCTPPTSTARQNTRTASTQGVMQQQAEQPFVASFYCLCRASGVACLFAPCGNPSRGPHMCAAATAATHGRILLGGLAAGQSLTQPHVAYWQPQCVCDTPHGWAGGIPSARVDFFPARLGGFDRRAGMFQSGPNQCQCWVILSYLRCVLCVMHQRLLNPLRVGTASAWCTATSGLAEVSRHIKSQTATQEPGNNSSSPHSATLGDS